MEHSTIVSLGRQPGEAESKKLSNLLKPVIVFVFLCGGDLAIVSEQMLSLASGILFAA